MSMSERRDLSRRAVSLVRRLAADPDERRYGAELMRDLEMQSGTLYPLLERLRQRGWVESEREDVVPEEVGRPARTYYRITKQGLDAVDELDRETIEELASRGDRAGMTLQEESTGDELVAVRNVPTPGERIRRSRAAGINDRSGYLNAVEYIEVDAEMGEGRVTIAANNHHHNQGAHIEGTPDDDAWSAGEFLAATSQIRASASELLGRLAGWPIETFTLAKPRVRDWNNHSISQALDTGLEVASPLWVEISALLHLRRWQFFRDIDHDMIDLYVAPSATYSWDVPSPAEELNSDVAQALNQLRPELLLSVTAIAQEVLMDPLVRLGCRSDVTWDSAPVHGGDTYRFRFVVIDRSDDEPGTGRPAPG